SERSKRRRCEGVGGTTPLERQVGMQIGSCLFAYDFGYKIIFLERKNDDYNTDAIKKRRNNLPFKWNYL
ncbi:hypothetical protein, partial [Traorella massiliensis]|uniref:hypothetical protein n=1 Tax=Traorella massiliensis TaxID=1903263 RepID=UPI001F3F4EAA